MKIVDIRPCYRITAENDIYGMEMYIDRGSKLQVTIKGGMTYIGYMERVDFGYYPKEGDMFVIRIADGTLYGIMVDCISDIKELQE